MPGMIELGEEVFHMPVARHSQVFRCAGRCRPVAAVRDRLRPVARKTQVQHRRGMKVHETRSFKDVLWTDAVVVRKEFLIDQL